jgi:glutathione S-transferase
MLTLIVGSKNYSSWSLRGWLAVKMTGAPFQEIVVALDRADTAAELASHSPSGRVPVLRDGPRVIWDSLAIAEYLAEEFRAERLWPADADDRAQARSLAAEMHAGFAALRASYPFNARRRAPRRAPPHDAAGAAADLARIETIWRGRRGPFLFGDFCLADAFFAPVASRFRSYAVPLAAGPAADYATALLAHPFVDVWHRAAADEPLPAPKYDQI